MYGTKRHSGACKRLTFQTTQQQNKIKLPYTWSTKNLPPGSQSPVSLQCGPKK